MAAKKKTFEENLADLEQIVTQLESGEVPLESAIAEFQKGMKLSQELKDTLDKAQETMVTIMNDKGEESRFDQE